MTPDDKKTFNTLLEHHEAAANTDEWGDPYGDPEATREALYAFIERREHELLQTVQQPPLFRQIMQASERYVTRFGGVLTPMGTLNKMQEEYDEFRAAISDLAVDGAQEESTLRALAAGELIDLLVTIGGVARAMGLTVDEIEQAGQSTFQKLEGRTHDRYSWNPLTMTVERKDRS